MFKVAFPWAKQAAEKAKREYVKSKQETIKDEIAGNIWMLPKFGMTSINDAHLPFS